jgi:hypothetical protein
MVLRKISRLLKSHHRALLAQRKFAFIKAILTHGNQVTP